MARPEKIGLEYFAFDTAFKDHPKVKMVIAEYQAKGYIITVELLCYIYAHKGYYMVWDEQTKLLFANSVAWCGATANLCELVVNFLVKWEFFDTHLFDSDKVLTNKRCQRNFLEAVRKRKNTFIDERFNLLKSKEPPKLGFTAEETPLMSEESKPGMAHWKTVRKYKYSDFNEEFKSRYTEITFNAFKKFNDWLDDEYPFIRERTEEQITIYDFQKLQKKFQNEVIKSGMKAVASSTLTPDHNLYARLVHFIENPFGKKAIPNQTVTKTTDLTQKDIYANG